MLLTAHERGYFMMGIATAMSLQSGYTNQIRFNDLQKIVQKLWQHYPPALPPYKNTLDGRRVQEPLLYRLRENPAPLETVLRDVQSGGVLVQDLSGRDTFRFAHKSYMEYLVSAFFSGFILQDKKDHLFLMKVNAITSAMGFKPSQLTPSPDVERFIAEQISSQVELEDKQGHPLPIRGNEQQYAKKLFQILTNHRIYYWFPNIAMWLTFNTYLKHFAIIGVLSVLSICSYSLLYINIKFFLSILCVLFFFWAFYYYKSFNLNTEQANSLYHRIMRIYIHICLLLSINIEYISKNSISILEKNKIYFGRNISVIFASICYITFILAANLIGPDLGKIDIILSFASLLVSYIPLASITFNFI
jgi:hypothetical protein